MTILTVLLATLFFAAWKAPRWVKEIGEFAFAFSFCAVLLNLRDCFSALSQLNGDVDPHVLYRGLMMPIIPVLYGTIIYLISLIVRVIQKPRL